jgi:hypothetical protein
MGRLAIGQIMPRRLFSSFAIGFLNDFFAVTTDLQAAVGRRDVEIRGQWVMGADFRARSQGTMPVQARRDVAQLHKNHGEGLFISDGKSFGGKHVRRVARDAFEASVQLADT